MEGAIEEQEGYCRSAKSRGKKRTTVPNPLSATRKPSTRNQARQCACGQISSSSLSSLSVCLLAQRMRILLAHSRQGLNRFRVHDFVMSASWGLREPHSEVRGGHDERAYLARRRKTSVDTRRKRIHKHRKRKQKHSAESAVEEVAEDHDATEPQAHAEGENRTHNHGKGPR